MRISLRQLAVFEAVARHESVSRGADDVAISQSAASMAIKELEESLGITLFHRQGRKLTINENGRRLQPMARSLLARAREILADRYGLEHATIQVEPVQGQGRCSELSW